MSPSVCEPKYSRTYLEVPVDPGFPVVLLDQFHLWKIHQLPIRIVLFFGIFFYYVFMALLLNIFGCVINLSLPTTKNKVKVLLEKAAAVKGENFTSERNLKILLPWSLFVLLNELGIFSKTVGLYLWKFQKHSVDFLADTPYSCCYNVGIYKAHGLSTSFDIVLTPLPLGTSWASWACLTWSKNIINLHHSAFSISGSTSIWLPGLSHSKN